jgi:uncharacterized protein
MRRKDREIKDKELMFDIINRADECCLAMSLNDQPYVIPVSYGFTDKAIYIHCALEGKKLDIIKQNPKVCLTFYIDMDIDMTGPANTWTAYYQSVVVFGNAELIEDLKERQKGMNVFLTHYAGKGMDFEDKHLAKVMVIKVTINEMTGKSHLAKT